MLYSQSSRMGDGNPCLSPERGIERGIYGAEIGRNGPEERLERRRRDVLRRAVRLYRRRENRRWTVTDPTEEH